MRPEFAIVESSQRGEYQVFTVDTKKATFQGLAWRTLGMIGKRNFEDLLVLTNIDKGLVQVLYV